MRSGTATSFLYDGWDIAQEQQGSTKTDVVLGLGIDERLSRAGSTFLTDALGSTVALASGTTVQTRYGYDAYGTSQVTGTASTNSFQYTGRENDGTGLLHYRNRYYNPAWGRFVSEDPIGLRGGINVYAYANTNPVNFRDPLGLCPGKKTPSTASSGPSKPQTPNMPPQPTCDTFLPNGQTIGQAVQAAIADIQRAAGDYDLLGAGKFGAFWGTVGSNGPIDFKNTLGPDRSGALGAAGNFAYGAIASGIGYSERFAEFGAGFYAATKGKSNFNNPFGEDDSAAANLGPGYATNGCTK